MNGGTHCCVFLCLQRLADNWCETISALDYIHLADMLYEAMESAVKLGHAVLAGKNGRDLHGDGYDGASGNGSGSGRGSQSGRYSNGSSRRRGAGTLPLLARDGSVV